MLTTSNQCGKGYLTYSCFNRINLQIKKKKKKCLAYKLNINRRFINDTPSYESLRNAYL